MPYKHSAEIGDVWKHLPLCEILEIEKPKRYFETNAAFASYQLEISERVKYGIGMLYGKPNDILLNSIYIKILDSIDFERRHIYFGSPALAMTILSDEWTQFYFHDIEKEPIEDIIRFSESLKKRNVTVSCGDSIDAFLNGSYRFNENDYVFIDPYNPFDCNEKRDTFFNVFNKALKCHAKTVLWFGYDSLNMRKAILSKFNAVSCDFTCAIHTFEIWQKSMQEDVCKVNPGVPGCGIATANLSETSNQKIQEYLKLIGCLYRDAIFEGEKAPLNTEYNVFKLK